MSGAPPDPRAAGLTLAVEDGIGWLVFDQPGEKVNVLSLGVLERFEALVREAAGRPGLRALVVASGKEGCFLAGADIDEIAAVADAEEGSRLAARGQAIFQALADLPVPTVAALNGVCLGGGLELALACDLRLASDGPEVRIGLPEVRLGILPGFGGTQRLPRLVGLRAALDLILTGRTLDPRRARRIGLLDRVVPAAYLRRETASLARLAAERGVAAAARRPRRGLAAWLLDGNPLGRRAVVAGARRKIAATAGPHYPAPPLALRSAANASRMDLPRGLREEARLVGGLAAGPVCKNLIFLFQAANAAKKRRGPEGAPPLRPVHKVGLLGAGTMGGGIAWLLAEHGIPVRMKDIRAEALASGVEAAAAIFRKAVRRRRIGRRDLEQRMARIGVTLDYRGFATADMVIEAVVENLRVKATVLGEIEARVADDCVLASNTSSLPIDRIAAGARRPGRVVGMHFFNPVDRMPLVEVIRGPRTDEAAVETVYALAVRLGKTPVVVQDRPGFLVNRILAPYLNEAVALVREGAAVRAVDAALRRFGMPMGPLELLDQVGIDVARHAGATLQEAFGDRMGGGDGLQLMVEAGRLGRKAGLGFYRHRGRRGEPDPAAEALLRRGAAGGSVPDEAAMVERCVLRMVDEAARCLEEGVVASAADLDLAMVMGTGFPPFRGGVLRHADALGAAAVAGRLEAFAAQLGPRFTPCDAILRAAREGARLAG